MAEPISSISGLASGIQWRDMIEQIMSIETRRQLDPITAQSSASKTRIDAWNAYSSVVAKLNTAAASLRDGTVFGNAKVTVGNSPTTSRALLSASATTGAAPGSYRVKVESLAAAERLGGVSVTDPNAALGHSGELRVNGRAVTVQATDSLYAIRDKFNAVNAGTQASRVTASVLTSGGRSQLVLTSDAPGAAGIDLDEVRVAPPIAGASTLLGALGLEDDATPATFRIGADGAVRSARMSSTTEAVLTALGVQTTPAPATLTVNGRQVVIDPSTDSLAEIVSLINAESPGTASIETTIDGAATWHRLKIAGTVSTDAASEPLVRAMGLTVGSRAANVTQRVTTGTALQLAADGTSATSSSTLDALRLTSGAGAVAAGDSFIVSGTTGDGFSVPAFAISITNASTETLDDVATQIEAGFVARGRAVSVAVENGKFVVSDTQSGASQLTVSISAVVAAGTIELGATTTEVGRARQLVSGRDAHIVVDGIDVRRSSNTVTDAIGGTTLTLQQAEPGTEITVDLTRDDDRVVQAVQDYAKAYNDVVSYVERSTAAGGALAFNTAMRSSLSDLRAQILSSVVGLPSGATYDRGGVVGVALNRDGELIVDSAILKSALTTNLSGVKSLFATAGVSSDAQLQYASSGSVTKAGQYSVDVTRAATKPTTLGAAFTFAGAAGDRMTVRDGVTGKEVSIDLSNGDSATTVADRLETAFRSLQMRAEAKVEGGALRLSSLDYGSSAAFTVSYTSPSATDIAGQLGIAAGEVKNGLDVEGTFTLGGVVLAATGAGQLLTGATGTAGEGLALRYSGAAPTASSITVDFALGIGGMIARSGELITRTGDGVVARNTGSLQTSIERFDSRALDVQERLERHRERLVRQFAAMEAALSRIQAQGNWLASQVQALQSSRD
jgi:flagellar hook-associated protein 2